LWSALLTAAYIAALSLFFFNAQSIFGQKEDNFLMPLLMLLLFVISAAITSFLVLGKPIRMYIDGAKREAVNLFFITLAWLFVFAVIVAVVLAKI
jgi:hypothetical protein